MGKGYPIGGALPTNRSLMGPRELEICASIVAKNAMRQVAAQKMLTSAHNEFNGAAAPF
ncbi:hypothetical protein [Undibacter mobilis]|uniref:hypothetical protein n=1 Tax=Undibacter mobilis TaxID=2292256 RepID=UPI00143CF15A|nr:hypothetical protein [Undibacter mobilis]